MAQFADDIKEVRLRLLVCGPPQGGKSTTLARCAELLGLADALPLACEPPLLLRIEFVEIGATDAARTCKGLAGMDGVLFVADSRRERLRDDVVAWAWLLEQLRDAGGAEPPVVLQFNRRDAPGALAAADLDLALGEQRFPSFETTADVPAGIAAAVAELARRAAARAHGELGEARLGLSRGAFVAAVDSVFAAKLRAPALAVATLGAAAVGAAAIAAAPPRPKRSPPRPRDPLLELARRMLRDNGRLSRDRRRLMEEVKWLRDESQRPRQFLRSLFAHLEREAPRLSAALEEAVGGGAEVLTHLEQVFARTTAVVTPGVVPRRERACDLAELAKETFVALYRDPALPPVRLRVSELPPWTGDRNGMRALLWALFSCALRAPAMRGDRPEPLRVAARATATGPRIRIGPIDVPKRQAGLEELVLARRLAARLGLRWNLVARPDGRFDASLDLGGIPVRGKPPARPAQPVSSA